MPRKFELQLKSWVPLVIESYLTYDTLNTFEIVKHSGRALVILGAEGQVDEILAVLDFLVKSNFLSAEENGKSTYFGVTFNNYLYTVNGTFKNLFTQSQAKTTKMEESAGEWIQQIKVENATHNSVNVYNFNLTFVLEKLIEVKAGLFNI